MFGSRLQDAFRGTSPEAWRAVWRHELQGYSGEEIARGLAGCRSAKHPPTLPEFLAMCRPSNDPEAAYHEAVEQMRRRGADGSDRWSHPAVFHAACAISFDLQRQAYSALRARWSVALDQARRDIESGRLPAEVPARPPALPEPEFKPGPIPPGIRERIASLVARMRNTTQTEGPDHAA